MTGGQRPSCGPSVENAALAPLFLRVAPQSRGGSWSTFLTVLFLCVSSFYFSSVKHSHTIWKMKKKEKLFFPSTSSGCSWSHWWWLSKTPKSLDNHPLWYCEPLGSVVVVSLKSLHMRFLKKWLFDPFCHRLSNGYINLQLPVLNIALLKISREASVFLNVFSLEHIWFQEGFLEVTKTAKMGIWGWLLNKLDFKNCFYAGGKLDPGNCNTLLHSSPPFVAWNEAPR